MRRVRSAPTYPGNWTPWCSARWPPTPPAATPTPRRWRQRWPAPRPRPTADPAATSQPSSAQLSQPTPPAEPGFLRHEGRWLGWTLALIGMAAVVALVGVALSRSVDIDLHLPGNPTQTPTTPPASTISAATTPTRFTQALAFDPWATATRTTSRQALPSTRTRQPPGPPSTTTGQPLAGSSPASGWSLTPATPWQQTSWTSPCSARAAASRSTAPPTTRIAPRPASRTGGPALPPPPPSPARNNASPCQARGAFAGTWSGSPACHQPPTIPATTRTASPRRSWDHSPERMILHDARPASDPERAWDGLVPPTRSPQRARDGHPHAPRSGLGALRRRRPVTMRRRVMVFYLAAPAATRAAEAALKYLVDRRPLAGAPAAVLA